MTPEVGEHARADLVGGLAAALAVLPGIETDGAKPGTGQRFEHRAHVVLGHAQRTYPQRQRRPSRPTETTGMCSTAKYET
jgi:hypothetical protein